MKIKMLLFVLFETLMIGKIVSAQILTNNGAAITITSGAQVTVKGDMHNLSSGTIDNSGTIDLSGNWNNNAGNNCFGTSAGNFIFNGAAQTIGGLSSTTFNNVILTGTGNKTLLADETVGGAYVGPAGVLQLNDKVLLLNSKSLSITNSNTTAITRTTGFIESETDPSLGYGYLQWNIGNSLPGSNFTFPFGNSFTSNYLPLQFNITSAGIGGANGYVKIATYPTSTAPNPNNRPLPTGLGQLISTLGVENAAHVADRYFIFDVANYTTRPVTDMSFSYRDLEWNTGTNTITEANLKMQKIINGTQAWTNPPFGSVNTVANTVTVTGWNQDYNPIWTIVDFTSPLPVELIDFKAVLNKNQKTDISWITSSEINMDYYDVEKSFDAINFMKLTSVSAQNTSLPIHNYFALDENPFIGTTYYRLKMVDKDGTVSYSKTESVSLNKMEGFFASVFPNPIENLFWLQLTGDLKINADWNMDIYDAIGKLVYSEKLEKLETNGNNVFKVNRNGIASGVYFLSVENKNTAQSVVLRIIIHD